MSIEDSLMREYAARRRIAPESVEQLRIEISALRERVEVLEQRNRLMAHSDLMNMQLGGPPYVSGEPAVTLDLSHYFTPLKEIKGNV